jgi:AcrR family transcriptional regulator
MATRKTRTREKKPSHTVPLAAAAGSAPLTDRTPASDEAEPNASRSLTRELDAAVVAALVAGTTETERGAIPPGAPTRRVLDPVIPVPAPTSESLDDLAQTLEAPAAPRMALLDAAEAVVGELGFARASDVAIARYAGVSIDVFRAHFATASALLEALTERFCTGAVSAANAATRRAIEGGASTDGVVAAAVRSLIDLWLGRAPLVRAMVASGDERLRSPLRTVPPAVARSTARLLAGTGAAVPEPELAFALLLTSSLAQHAVLVGTPFDRDALASRAARAATAYLREPPRRR